MHGEDVYEVEPKRTRGMQIPHFMRKIDLILGITAK